MAKESIMRIAEAERAAQEEITRAEAECAQMLRDAEAEAKRIVEQARGAAQKRVDAKVAEAKSAIATIEKNAANDARGEAALLQKSAAAGHDGAVKLVIDALVDRA